MRCPKCKGKMIIEKFFGQGSDKGESFVGARCVNCGKIIDQTIEMNQALIADQIQKLWLSVTGEGESNGERNIKE